MKMHIPKMKPQVVSYQEYKDFHKETFLDSLKHEINVQGQFLNKKGLDDSVLSVHKFLISMLLKKAVCTI